MNLSFSEQVFKRLIFRLTGLMADSLDSYTHAFHMSGAVVIAGAFIPFLLLFSKSKESRETLPDLSHFNEAVDDISVIMDPRQGEEANTGSRRSSIVYPSPV